MEIKTISVVGAGTMGGDIAAWCVVSGMQASLQDLDEAQIAKALARAGEFQRAENLLWPSPLAAPPISWRGSSPTPKASM